MAEEFGEKTEAPSQKRRKDAAEKGDVLRSRELGVALVMLAGCGWIALFGHSLLGGCKELITASLSFGRGDVEDWSPWRPLAAAGWRLAPGLFSLFAMTIAAAVMSSAGLGSLTFNATLLAPKAQRINPAAGLKRMFGSHGWIELGKSLLKVVLLGAIGGWMLWSTSRMSLGLVSMDLGGAVGALGGTFVAILFAMAIGLAIIAGIDVPLQAVQLFRKLRMSKQELKDEHKESDGNPENKAAIRGRAMQIAKRGVRKAVAEAHVVLTNPTHFAVALRYERGADQVPVVVAKGRGATALAIRELAGEMRVPTLEYPSIARALYYTSREGQEIRDDLYLAVATILAFVFNLNAAAGGSAVQPDVPAPASARFDENGVTQPLSSAATGR